MPIPTNLEYQVYGEDAPLVEVKARDEENYQYSYFAKTPPHPSPSSEKMGRVQGRAEPVYYRRKDYPDAIYRTIELKLRSIIAEIVRYHAVGRPMLVGTTSVESSDRLSNST